MPEGVVADILLNLQIVHSMNSQTTSVAVMYSVTPYIGVVNITVQVEVQRIAAHNSGLPSVDELSILHSADRAHLCTPMNHNVASIVLGRRLTLNHNISAKKTNFNFHREGLGAISFHL